MIYFLLRNQKEVFFPLVGHNKVEIEGRIQKNEPWVIVTFRKIGGNLQFNLQDESGDWKIKGKTDLLCNYLYLDTDMCNRLATILKNTGELEEGEYEYSIYFDDTTNEIGRGIIKFESQERLLDIENNTYKYQEAVKVKMYEG